jgi:hypothetical protein
VNEIRIKDNQAEITGSIAALAFAMLENTKVDTVVPTFVPNWLPDLRLLRTARIEVLLPHKFMKKAA